jgi:MerR family transcriptional regulator, light-induced transcriptional regulator
MSAHLALPSVAPWQQRLPVQREEETGAVSSTGVTVAVSRRGQKGRQGMTAGQQQPWDKSSATSDRSTGLGGSGAAAGATDGRIVAAGMHDPSDESSQRSHFARQSAGGMSHEAQLTQFIRRQVIPRLAVAHGLPQKSKQPSVVVQKPSIESLRALADLAIREDFSAVVAYVEALVERGVPIEDAYLEWLAPAARQMGCDWESDRTDFSSVTIGMWKLQQAMHALSPTFLKDTLTIKSPRRILLASVPGEQHTMGLFMVSEFFRRGGWDVWSELPSNYEDIVGKARGEWFDLIGLSVGGDHKLEALTQAIAALRRASRNAEVLIMLGGPILVSNPEIAVAVGADFAAGDARHAVARAEKAVASRLSEQFRR